VVRLENTNLIVLYIKTYNFPKHRSDIFDGMKLVDGRFYAVEETTWGFRYFSDLGNRWGSVFSFIL
jgi:hypothetical protein